MRTIRQGLGWAFGYNLLLIPVAAGALYSWDHLLLDPILASAAMAMSSVSVVSNALRLRRFTRPETAQEILQPKLTARVGDYAYLTTVAAVALALGATFTWASRTETASHGMNGLLAWTEGMGMPMRPAMSIMETTDTPPISSPRRRPGRHPGAVRPARAPGRPRDPTGSRIRDTDGNPVTDLVRTHQVWAHLILTRKDSDGLGTFAHIHPEPTGTPGSPRGHHHVPDRRHLPRPRRVPPPGLDDRRPGPHPDRRPRHPARRRGDRRLPRDGRTVTTDGVRVQLTGDAVVGETSGQASDFGLRFTDASTGRPVTGIQPYLGAAGHIVILRNDGTRFAHAHAETTDPRGRPTFATPGSTFGPELDFHTRFETSGTYRLWGQFRLADGDVITDRVHRPPAPCSEGSTVSVRPATPFGPRGRTDHRGRTGDPLRRSGGLGGVLVLAEDGAGRQGSADQGVRDHADLLAMLSGVGAECDEGGRHVDLSGLGEDALGLLDHDPAAQCALQLLGDDRGAVDGALLEDADGGHVGQGTGDPLVGHAQR